MDLDIISNAGAGPIRFGMTRDDVRQTIGQPYQSFLKTPTSNLLTDAFVSNSVQVFYKKPGLCEAIEVSAPSQANMNGTGLVGLPYTAAKAFLQALDSNLEEDEAGAISYAVGVAVYAPSHKKQPSLPVEAVLIFEQGYYD